MFTDMVGYTALGQRNESLSLVLVEEQRKLIRPILSRHSGREIKTMGDAFLVEFPSALEAVRCAFDIQRATREFNITLPSDRRIHLRVGLHLGDVIESRGDISGDAVNVASRIEPLAEDGGVCLTREVFAQVSDKIDLQMISLGKKALKNVAAAVEVYKIVMPWESVEGTRGRELETRRIAVLPLVSMSPDPNDEYFADGMTEEIISTLSGIETIEVISMTSVMQYKRAPKPIRQVSKELEAGTILEGSVRKAGSMLRVTVQMIDAIRDRHMWAKSYDRDLKDVFAIQSDVAQRVAETLKVSLQGTVRALEKAPTNNVSAYESYLRGVYLTHKGPSDWSGSVKHFENAISMDPNFAMAYAALANVYVGLAGDFTPPRETCAKAESLVSRALELDENSSDAHLAKGNLAMQYRLDWDSAEKEFQRAIELNPSNANAHWWYSMWYTFVKKDPEEAMREARRAQELDPLSLMPQATLFALELKRDYQSAVGLMEKSVQLEPGAALNHLVLARVYCEAGRLPEGEREVAVAQQLKPTLYDLGILSEVLAVTGKSEESRMVLREVEDRMKTQYYSLTNLARTYLALGESDEALHMLEEGYDEFPFSFLFVYRDTIFDSVRNNPRFLALETRLKLPG
jgi:TolB-like protein/lipopolysaccharide biosynthesis regulator YciM